MIQNGRHDKPPRHPFCSGIPITIVTTASANRSALMRNGDDTKTPITVLMQQKLHKLVPGVWHVLYFHNYCYPWKSAPLQAQHTHSIIKACYNYTITLHSSTMAYGIRRFNAVFTRVLQYSLSRAESVQFLVFLLMSLRSFLKLSSHLRLGLPEGLFPKGYKLTDPRWSWGNVLASRSWSRWISQDVQILIRSPLGGTLSWGYRVWDFRLVKEPQAWKKRPPSKI